tara:strand:- start:222 stop:323 length:102 start_codon:yes stop_codon:yes gene_type:complete
MAIVDYTLGDISIKKVEKLNQEEDEKNKFMCKY